MQQTQSPKAGERTLTQSEHLKAGERGEYISQSEPFNRRIAMLGITCWVSKSRVLPSESDLALRPFISTPNYRLEYGITFEGKDYGCGDMPRDLGKVVRGIAIAKGVNY